MFACACGSWEVFPPRKTLFLGRSSKKGLPMSPQGFQGIPRFSKKTPQGVPRPPKAFPRPPKASPGYRPSPAQPSQARPSPAWPSPAWPCPAQPIPARPNPAQPSLESGPAQPSPAWPCPTRPIPARPKPCPALTSLPGRAQLEKAQPGRHSQGSPEAQEIPGGIPKTPKAFPKASPRPPKAGFSHGFHEGSASYTKALPLRNLLDPIRKGPARQAQPREPGGSGRPWEIPTDSQSFFPRLLQGLRSLAFLAGSTKALPLRFGFSIVSTKALPLRNFFGNSACSVSQEHEGPAS